MILKLQIKKILMLDPKYQTSLLGGSNEGNILRLGKEVNIGGGITSVSSAIVREIFEKSIHRIQSYNAMPTLESYFHSFFKNIVSILFEGKESSLSDS